MRTHPSVSSSRKSFADVVKLNLDPKLIRIPLVFNRIKQDLVSPIRQPSRPNPARIVVVDSPDRSSKIGISLTQNSNS